MTTYFDLLDAVNDATSEIEHREALIRLHGWRLCLEDIGLRPDHCAADLHTMARYGEDRPMCCGVLLDWAPSAEG